MNKHARLSSASPRALNWRDSLNRLRASAQGLSAASILLLGVTFAQPASAQTTLTYTGASGAPNDFGAAENYSGSVLPSTTTGDTALFDGTYAGNLLLTYSNAAFAGAVGEPGILLSLAGTQTGSLNIDSGANTSSLRLNDITIASGAGAFSLGNSTGIFNIALGGATGATRTFANNSANTVTLASDVAFVLDPGTTRTLAIGGSGNWAFNNAITNGGGTSLALNKTGAGVLTLTPVTTAATPAVTPNTFTGGLTISQGTVSFSDNTALGGAGGTAGAITLNGGTLSLTGSGSNVGNTHPITVGAGGGGINNLRTGTYVFNAANTLLGSGTLTFTGDGVALRTNSVGAFVLQAANTFNGNVVVQGGGIIEYANTGAVAAGSAFTLNNLGELSANQVIVPGAVTVNAGGVLGFQNGGNGVFTGAISLSGDGTVALRDWYNANNSRNGQINGNITGPASLNLVTGTGAATLTLLGTSSYTGATTLGANTTLYTFESTSRTYANVISGAGAFTKAGPFTLTLSGAELYTGATTINGGVLQVGDGTSGSLNGTTGTTLTIQGTGTFERRFGAAGGAQGMGALTLSQGEGTVRSVNTGGTTALTFASLSARAGQTAGNFVVSGGTNGSTNKISFTTPPAIAALLDRGYFFNGSSYAAYDAGGYLRAYGPGDTGYATAAGANGIASGTTNNVALTSDVTAQATASVNTLNLGSFNATLNGGAVLSTNGILQSGNSAATLSGGSISTTTSGAELIIRVNGSLDTLNLGAPILANGSNLVTKSGAGTLTLSGAGNSFTNFLTVDAGVLNFNGTYAGTASALVVKSGVLNLNNTVSSNSNFRVGDYGVGVLNSNSGTQTSTGGFFIASSNLGGRGVFNVTGGTLSGPATIGTTVNNPGVINIVNTGAYNTTGAFYLSENGGIGILNMANAGTLLTGNTGLRLVQSNVNTGVGIANLGAVLNGGSGSVGGGTITTSSVNTNGALGTSTFNFHGGTLKPSAASTAFFTGLTSAYVYGEGGTVDNNSVGITIGQPLLAPTGNGLTALTLGGTTTGFRTGATPMVVISGGGGSGATGRTSIDGSGNLSIILTNPGVGYTSAPTVALLDPLGNTATTAAATLGANTSGGLTFQGSGTTTLSGISTYTGGTNIAAGSTLTLAAGGSAGAVRGAVTVNSGATLNLTAADALGYTAGTQVTAINVNGGTVNSSAGNQGYLTSFNLTGGAVAGTSLFRFNVNDPIAPGITSLASATGSTFAANIDSFPASAAAGSLPISVAKGSTAANVADLTISGVIISGGGITKTGAGVLSLTGSNTYSGSTTVNGGTLLVNNTPANPLLTTSSGTGTGAVTVGSDVPMGPNTPGTLGGTGSIVGAVTINPNSTITGGTVGTVGALTLQSTLTLTGGIYAVDFSTDGATADRLNITGALSLTNANITFNGTPTAPSYVLATFASATGTFSGIAPSGYTFQFNDPTTPTELDLVAVPEPATWAAGCLLLGLVGVSQRRKIIAMWAAARGC